LLGQKDTFVRGLVTEFQEALSRPLGWISTLEDTVNRINENIEKGKYSWPEIRFDNSPVAPPKDEEEDETFSLKNTIIRMSAEAANRVVHGDFEEAIRLYIECCERDPSNLPCRKKLRDAQMKNLDNKPPTGFSIGWSSTRSKLQSLTKSGQHTKALEVGEIGLSTNPWDSAVMRYMGRAADELGFSETASWLFQSALKISPNDMEILQDLAEFLVRQKDFRSARILWEKIHRLNPTDHESAEKAKELGAAETMKRMADNKDAGPSLLPKENASIAEEQRARNLIAEQPHWPNHYIELANILKKSYRFAEAEQTLRRGIIQSNGDKKLLLEFAHFEKQMLGKRIDELKFILSLDGTWSFAKIAEDCLKTEQRRRDSELLKLRAEADPNNMNAKLELGQMLLDLGDIDAAITELQQSRKDPRLTWKALSALGKCFSLKGNTSLARRNLEDALKSLPQEEEVARKEILFMLAESFAASGDFAKAVEIGNDIANIDFSYQSIGKLLDEWILRSKQV